MNKSTTKSDEILELLSLMLEGSDEPMHYKHLTEAIEASGVYELSKIYSRPSDSIYGILIAGIRKGTLRYSFLGKGIFAGAGVILGAEDLVVTPSEPTAYVPKARKLPVINGMITCIDCEFISMSDIQILGDQNCTAGCSHGNSGRDYTSKSADICPFFKQKDINALEKEHIRKLKLQELVNGINAVTKKVARASA